MTVINDEKAIRDCIASWVRAAEASDYEGVFRLITEDAVMLIAGLPPFTSRQQYADFVLKAVRPGRRFKVAIDIHEVVVNGDWAHVWAHERSAVIRQDDAPVQRASGESLNILRRGADGKWLVAVAANMMTMEGI